MQVEQRRALDLHDQRVGLAVLHALEDLDRSHAQRQRAGRLANQPPGRDPLVIVQPVQHGDVMVRLDAEVGRQLVVAQLRGPRPPSRPRSPGNGICVVA